jgi:hypothetical protein
MNIYSDFTIPAFGRNVTILNYEYVRDMNLKME